VKDNRKKREEEGWKEGRKGFLPRIKEERMRGISIMDKIIGIIHDVMNFQVC
jgi:hypothetical protein